MQRRHIQKDRVAARRRVAKRRESSSLWYGELTGDVQNPAYAVMRMGLVIRDPLDSQLADRAG